MPRPPPPRVPPPAGALSPRTGTVLAANRARQAAGLRPLRPDPRLDRAAQGWAAECARLGKLSHFGPDGSSPWSRMRAEGFPATSATATEVAAWGQRDGAEAVGDWLGSKVGHREAVLDQRWDRSGSGMALGRDGRAYWILCLGRG